MLIAPDSFKGSLRATAVADALAAGWLAVRPGDRVTRLPLADGGEGTLEVLAVTVPGARWHRARVTGPGGVPVTCRWLSVDLGEHSTVRGPPPGPRASHPAGSAPPARPCALLACAPPARRPAREAMTWSPCHLHR